MTLPPAILFDLDDTILDTTDSSTRVWRSTAARFAREVGRPPHEINTALDQVREAYWADPDRNKAGRLDLFNARTEVVYQAFQALDKDDRDLADRFAHDYTRHRVDAMQPFPGAIQTIQTLKHKGIKLGLLSNGHGSTQREKVTRFGLEALFDVVLIEGEFGIGKPDPRIFEHALEVLQVQAQQTWMVGDNLEWEVQAPQQLGMRGIWVDWANKGLPDDSPYQPDRIIRSLAELI